MIEDSLATATGSPEPTTADGPQPAHLGIVWVHPEPRFWPFQDRGIIGRLGPGLALELAGAELSRHHARVEQSGPSWLLRDLGSKNGTWVNGARHDVVPLFDQDVVRLGEWVGVVGRGDSNETLLFGEVAPSWCAGPVTLRRMVSLRAKAKTDIPVLICGETGTGKEVVARAVHHLSGRSGEFVALNCAAVPEAMAEALLFGHRQGAFTGAVKDADGVFATADGGTLFLDEIGDLSEAVQAKLLRVLEGGTFTPLGAHRAKRVDVRVVAASQDPLRTLVEQGSFRSDLFARLCGVELSLQPLRERKEEVLELFQRFLRERDVHAQPTARFVERLLCYDFPYNVRELVQLARALAPERPERLVVEHLPSRFDAPEQGATEQCATEQGATESTSERLVAPQMKGRRAAWLIRHATELSRLQNVLNGNGWNVAEAAREVGIPRHRALRLLAAQKAFQ